MEGTDGRRRLVFVAVVVVLAAIGVYLTMLGGGDTRTEHEAAPTGRSAPTGVTVPAVPSQVASTPSGEFDVYAYLPLSRDELAAAADLARRFVGAYGTYTHADPVARVDRVRRFATVEFGEQLTRSLTAPALTQHDTAEQIVSDGSAKVISIRDMALGSVVFVVDSIQHITSTAGARDQTDSYAVTVMKLGTDWRVYDMQPADAGQDGDTSP
ncbi:hypothetical protein Aph01nite_62090 [Acrocarpospora phusangensis]|uniref:Mce-associated membrane protein n=1 Tax=Acrocarpospora phusangensis TaxID=1070424 RepID=A0A919QEV9_9ACTN|nr:hypothetical protein [Acrocarpospora phusangensis]GIH27899.1 hypothetical protein Aph01nite_62090 [Acrocarpospora phusangensis]